MPLKSSARKERRDEKNANTSPTRFQRFEFNLIFQNNGAAQYVRFLIEKCIPGEWEYALIGDPEKWKKNRHIKKI